MGECLPLKQKGVGSRPTALISTVTMTVALNIVLVDEMLKVMVHGKSHNSGGWSNGMTTLLHSVNSGSIPLPSTRRASLRRSSVYCETVPR